jgi:hypothetical protein
MTQLLGCLLLLGHTGLDRYAVWELARRKVNTGTAPVRGTTLTQGPPFAGHNTSTMNALTRARVVGHNTTRPNTTQLCSALNTLYADFADTQTAHTHTRRA